MSVQLGGVAGVTQSVHEPTGGVAAWNPPTWQDGALPGVATVTGLELLVCFGVIINCFPFHYIEIYLFNDAVSHKSIHPASTPASPALTWLHGVQRQVASLRQGRAERQASVYTRAQTRDSVEFPGSPHMHVCVCGTKLVHPETRPVTL